MASKVEMAISRAAEDASPEPNATVYVKNLEERIKIPDLVSALREVFSECGTILDIVAKKNVRARGQAFVVFDNVDSAQTAIDDLQGFVLFDKEMHLDFAKTKSDAIVQKEGTEEDFEAHKRRRIAAMERKKAAEVEEKAKAEKKRAAEGEPDTQRINKAVRGAGLKSAAASAAGVVPDEYLPPNTILFVRNVPDDYDVDKLTAIFSRFPDFKEVRSIAARKGIAFVEYNTMDGAISAKEATANMTLGDSVIKVTFQRQ